MITIAIQELAKRQGIKTAYQLQKATGYPPSMSARIWRGEWKTVNLRVLNKLCHVLKCEPSQLLKFSPDDDF